MPMPEFMANAIILVMLAFLGGACLQQAVRSYETDRSLTPAEQRRVKYGHRFIAGATIIVFLIAFWWRSEYG